MVLSSVVIASPSRATVPDVARILNDDGSSSTAIVPAVVGTTWPCNARIRIALLLSMRRSTFRISIHSRLSIACETTPGGGGIDGEGPFGVTAPAELHASIQTARPDTATRAEIQRLRMPL